MDKYDYYAYIGVHDNKDYDYFTLLVDTNVAINLERFYYTPRKLHVNKLSATIDFLLDNIDKDTVFGFALQEACWDYSLKSLNEGQYDKMQTALTTQYDWDIKFIKSHSSTNGISSDKEVVRTPSPDINSLIDQFSSNPTMIISYACVLKIMILEKKYPRKSKKAIEDFIDFIDNILYYNPALEVQVAIYYFLGKDDSYTLGNALFKFDKRKSNVLLKAWNTCWDLFYLRLLQRSYYLPEESNSFSPKLVTSDYGLITLASLCSLEATINIGNNEILPIISFKTSDILPEFSTYVDEVQERLYFGCLDRDSKRNKTILRTEYLLNLISELEKEIITLSQLD